MDILFVVIIWFLSEIVGVSIIPDFHRHGTKIKGSNKEF
jgi:hypothetical protein